MDKGTSGRVNKLIVKKDRVTRGRVDKLDEWTSEQVNCEGRQSNKGTSGRVNKLIVNELIAKEDKVTGEQGVSTYNIWGEKGLKKARD